jgi:hypothetical protein
MGDGGGGDLDPFEPELRASAMGSVYVWRLWLINVDSTINLSSGRVGKGRESPGDLAPHALRLRQPRPGAQRPGAGGRPRLYALADLDRLKARRDARAGHGAVAAGALRWGEPVLDSAITAITPRGPAYRGRLAVDLAAAGARFEDVAELLWSGFLPEAPGPLAAPVAAAVGGPASRRRRSARGDGAAGPARRPRRADRRDPRPDALVGQARRLIPLLAAALAPGYSARALGAGRSPPSPPARSDWQSPPCRPSRPP